MASDLKITDAYSIFFLSDRKSEECIKKIKSETLGLDKNKKELVFLCWKILMEKSFIKGHKQHKREKILCRFKGKKFIQFPSENNEGQFDNGY